MVASLPTQLLWHEEDPALMDVATEQKTTASDFLVLQEEADHSYLQTRGAGLTVDELGETTCVSDLESARMEDTRAATKRLID